MPPQFYIDDNYNDFNTIVRKRADMIHCSHWKFCIISTDLSSNQTNNLHLNYLLQNKRVSLYFQQ